MRALFEFKCPAGHISEIFADSETRTDACETCGKPAPRIISAVRSKLDPISGDFIGATDKWMRQRSDQKQRETRAIENHGPDAAWDLASR